MTIIFAEEFNKLDVACLAPADCALEQFPGEFNRHDRVVPGVHHDDG